jgi:hypothetical protein
MLKFLKALAGLFQSFFGGLFMFFGSALLRTVQVSRSVLEAFGIMPPALKDAVGDIAESALDQARAQRSSLDRRPPRILTPDQRLNVIHRWAEWRSNGRTGPEPALDCLTLREKIRLRQAHDSELHALFLRLPAEVDAWLNGQSARLVPLAPAEVGKRADAIGLARHGADKMDAQHDFELDMQEARIAIVRAERIENDKIIAEGFRKLGLKHVLGADAPVPRPRFGYA